MLGLNKSEQTQDSEVDKENPKEEKFSGNGVK